MDRAETTEAVISLAREDLRIDRRVIDRGGVRVRVRVEERDETVDALLSEQSVDVERVPIGRVIDTIPNTRQEGDVFIIPVVEEVLVIERRLVLREEVRVRRTEQQRPTRETARVRREVAEVETILPGEPQRSST